MPDDSKDAGFWNLPNALTLARIPLLVVGIVLIESGFSGGAILGVVLLFLGMISDFLDGFLARKMGLTSRWGAVLDPLIDKFFVLGLCTWLLMEEWLPGWCLWLYLAILLRELAVTGLRGGSLFPNKGGFGADKLGKWKTTAFFVSQVGFLIAVAVIREGWSDVVGIRVVDALRLTGVGAFVIAAFLTVWSGWRYFARMGRSG